MRFPPRDPDFERRVRASFARQTVMSTLGVALDRIAPGEVDLSLSFRSDLAQQHGFLHAGIVTTVMDSACGYAALTLMDPGTGVLSVEFKVQLLAPARGARFQGRGRVIKSGRTLLVVAGELRALSPSPEAGEDGESPPLALLSGTMMTIRDRPELSD